MGDVYQATDSKLGRSVAIKLLPESFVHDANRVARFEREARVLASLNHPNIATIYGLEDANDKKFLAMELVSGETLAERIERGPIPIEEALGIARQIAAALEAAHEQGIIHRDLKPANIKVREDNTVKVLDFGLAKAMEASSGASASISQSPTMSIHATEAGIILGTATYMSPEQARGKTVDKRADIWAFGCVFYEMLTGQRLIQGETVTDVLGAVLHQELDWRRVPPRAVPALQRCLQRDPKDRLRDIGDVMAWLNVAAPAFEPPQARRRRAWPAIAAVLIVLVVGATVAAGIFWPRTPDRPLLRFNVDLGPDTESSESSTLAISPDGSRIAFLKRASGAPVMLATRLLSETSDTILAGTEGASDPFFSDDGEWIGFFAAARFYKTSIRGGSPVRLAEAPNPRGASWGKDGTIVAALVNVTGLTLLPPSGGTPRLLTEIKSGELTHRWPQILPGGEAAIFTVSSNIDFYDDGAIEAVSLKDGARRTLVQGGYFGRYIPSNGSTGHLVYIHQGGLLAVKFDPARLEVQSNPVPILDDVASNSTTAGGHFDFSQALSGTGIFGYRNGHPSGAISQPLVRLDSSGNTKPFTKPGVYNSPRFSPDGRQLALSVTGSTGTDLFVYDFQKDTMSARTFTGQDNTVPVWTPDGRFIIFRSTRPKEGLYAIRSDGSGEPQLLLEGNLRVVPTSFSPGAANLVYQALDSKNGNDIWTVSLDWSDVNHPKAGTPELFERSPGNDRYAMFSPDGHWIAHETTQAGHSAIYVRTFPASSGKWLITEDASYPVWSNNGRELFFENDRRIWVVDYTTKDGAFSAGKPRLWAAPRMRTPTGFGAKDLDPDGKSFVVTGVETPGGKEQGSVHVTFLLNFFDELRRRVP